MNIIVQYRITIKGKVQGVNYRTSAQAIALKLGLNGFVRNQHNGDVYMEAEGEEEALRKLVDWCIIGPARSEVSEVQAEPGVVKNFGGFEIRR